MLTFYRVILVREYTLKNYIVFNTCFNRMSLCCSVMCLVYYWDDLMCCHGRAPLYSIAEEL